MSAAAERPHALLAPSAAHRWLACPPSARLEQRFPDTGSPYAAEGTLAHAVAELKAKCHLLKAINKRKLSVELKKLKESTTLYDEAGQARDPETYWPEIMRHTDAYIEHIQEIIHSFRSTPYIAVEKRLDFSAWVPEGFGTGDCIVIGGDTLHIIDLKYGTGVAVSAENNPQMRLYALGAWDTYRLFFPIKCVRMTIFQPRRDSITSEEITVEELLAWGDWVRPIAAQAYRGEGEFSVGEHCRFCRAKAQCRARAEYYLSLEPYQEKDPALLSNEEIGEILHRARSLADWAKHLEEYALAAILNGEYVPGWKAVEGRTSRQYSDIDACFQHLIANGIDEAILYERRPLSVAQLEKALGKKQFTELAGQFIIVEPGKPTLAPESDKRPAINTQIQAKDVFTAIN